MTPLQIPTKDGVILSASHFSPKVPNGKLLLINSATGVKQGLYFNFAQYLSGLGFHVITYDYRGIGLSAPKNLKGYNASMRDWGRKDFDAAAKYLFKEWSELSPYLLGHSVGALILGHSEESKRFEKLVFVGTQEAFVGNLRLGTRVQGYLGFGLIEPISTSLLGYFPSNRLGLGERLPKGSSLDWKKLILHKESTNALLDDKERSRSRSLNQETLVLSALDDAWLTRKGVASLLKNTYPSLKADSQFLHPSESPRKNIGHVNFFRSYNQNLWKKVSDFLL